MKSRSAKMKWFKIDEEEGFGLYRHHADPNLYQVRSRNSSHFIRRQFKAVSAKRALDKAAMVLGVEPPVEEAEPIDLVDAFSLVLENTSRGEKSRRDWLYFVKRFLVWTAKEHPRCTHWGLLTRQIVKEYLQVYREKSANTRRLALQPIAQTSGFMARERGFTDIATRLNIGSRLKTTPKMVYVADVVGFCDWLAAHRPMIEAGVALQGLAGLQLQEALRLTWDRVCLERGLVEIAGEVKNEYRKRVIPVADRVVEALRRVDRLARANDSKVLPVRPSVVSGVDGGAIEDYGIYSRQVRKALKKWNPKIEWAPKDLRNCLPTLGTALGVWNAVWEQYIGHAPGTVTARHYVPRLTSVSLGEADALDRQMGMFRLQVLEPLNQAIRTQSQGAGAKALRDSKVAAQ